MTYLENILSLESKTNTTPKQTLILYIDKGINPFIKASNLITSLESKDIQVVIHEGTKLGETVMYTGQLDNNAVVDGVYYEELDTNLPNARHVKLITASSKNEIPSHVEHIYLDETDEGLDEVFNTVSFESKSNIKLHRTPESILKEYSVEVLLPMAGLFVTFVTVSSIVRGIVKGVKAILSKIKPNSPKVEKVVKSYQDEIKEQLFELDIMESEGKVIPTPKEWVSNHKALMVGAKDVNINPLVQLKEIEKALDNNIKVTSTAIGLLDANSRAAVSFIATMKEDTDTSVFERKMYDTLQKVSGLYARVIPFGADIVKYTAKRYDDSLFDRVEAVDSTRKADELVKINTLSTPAELKLAVDLYRKCTVLYGILCSLEWFDTSDLTGIAGQNAKKYEMALNEISTTMYTGIWHHEFESYGDQWSQVVELQTALFHLIKESVTLGNEDYS